MNLVILKVVTLGETKPLHSKSIKVREWMLGDVTVNGLYEYKNLGVLKNYVNSFASNVDDNIDKSPKKRWHNFLLLTLTVKNKPIHFYQILEASMSTFLIIWHSTLTH